MNACKFRCADLYCCAGGSAMGLNRVGFEIEGWDIHYHKNYPFTFHYGNALDADLTGFDFVWASPPCQKHSDLAKLAGGHYECFIERTRQKLIAWGGPYIVENVDRAPLLNPVMLCGSMFGLNVRRHRLFESNIKLVGGICRHDLFPEPIDVTGTGYRRKNPRTDGGGGDSRKPINLAQAREVMGMPWASRLELSQAIPPAYAEHLGWQVIRFLQGAKELFQNRS